jgi:hypothetical protein
MDDYVSYNCKPLRHPRNKEFVTSRVNIINKKKVIRISIGILICELIQFTRDDRVHIFLNKKDKNLMLIKKSDILHDGYKLNHGGSNNSFMTVDFRYETSDSFRLSQTIILDYEIKQDGLLLINFEKLKWNN